MGAYAQMRQHHTIMENRGHNLKIVMLIEFSSVELKVYFFRGLHRPHGRLYGVFCSREDCWERSPTSTNEGVNHEYESKEYIFGTRLFEIFMLKGDNIIPL